MEAVLGSQFSVLSCTSLRITDEALRTKEKATG